MNNRHNKINWSELNFSLKTRYDFKPVNNVLYCLYGKNCGQRWTVHIFILRNRNQLDFPPTFSLFPSIKEKGKSRKRCSLCYLNSTVVQRQACGGVCVALAEVDIYQLPHCEDILLNCLLLYSKRELLQQQDERRTTVRVAPLCYIKLFFHNYIHT
jgi:hypothetical protein